MNENQKKIKACEAAISRIQNQAAQQNRGLLDVEKQLVDDLQEELAGLYATTPVSSLTMQNGPLTTQGAQLPVGRVGSELYSLRGPADQKDYHSMFGSNGVAWNDKESNYFQALFSGRFHPELKNATMTETIPSDGGFLVPTEYSRKIHDVALENEIVLPRALVQPMTTNAIKIPAMAIGSHSSSLMGGFVASFVDELGTISEANPKTRSMELVTKKLVGMIRFSNELVADVPGGIDQIIRLCGRGLGWYRDRAFLKGTGAGQPLGILNASCTIVVSKETGQGQTILYENIVKMMSHLFPGSFQNSTWICHQSTIPALMELSLPIGTAGAHIPVLSETNGQYRILSRPVVFTEKTETLGTKGDIMLCDLSQYVIGLRSELRFDTSIHVGFTTDELLARLISRFDGQPLWDSYLTLEDGVTTVSPFVVLETRS